MPPIESRTFPSEEIVIGDMVVLRGMRGYVKSIGAGLITLTGANTGRVFTVNHGPHVVAKCCCESIGERPPTVYQCRLHPEKYALDESFED